MLTTSPNMEFRCHLEFATKAGPAGDLLLLRGWGIRPDGRPAAAWRLRRADGATFPGFGGIARPDVAAIFGRSSEADLLGFSFLVPTAGGDRCEIEWADDAQSWEACASVRPAELPTDPSLMLVPEEAGGWAPPAPPRHSAAKPPPVLFITHDFAAAGAQLLLLRLVQWLRRNTAITLEILAAVPRQAVAQASAAERRVLDGLREAGPLHFLSDATGAPENLARIRAGGYRLIHANTGTLGWLLPALRPLPCPVISHIHELGFWLERRTGLARFARQAACTDRFVACSTPVRDYLVRRAAVPPERIDVIHDCASTARARALRAARTRAEVRRELNLPADAFVVAACGTYDWRKGADLWVPLCVALQRVLAGREWRALWIGDPGSELVRHQFEHEAAAAGVADRVRLLGQQAEPLPWMHAADSFALVSREDPFPIVMLEAASLELPVVAFTGSGGADEFVADDAGRLVPYLDVEAFARALADLAEDPGHAQQLGRTGGQKAATQFDEERSFALLRDLIERTSHRRQA